MHITRINPDGLHQTPGYHHVTVVESGRTAYLAGQCPVAPDGSIPPADDLPAQLELTISNCLTVLACVGARPEDVVRSVIYVVTDDQHELSSVWAALNDSALGPAFSSASTLLGVAQLGFPGQRIEVDLTAALAT